MRWGQVAALAAGAAVLAWMLAAVGVDGLIRSVTAGGPALPAAIGIHGVQILLAGLAWFETLGRGWTGAAGLGRVEVARVRWIREGVNTLLPVAHIGGQVVGVRLLVVKGMVPVRAVVGTILDLALEAASQMGVLLLATALLLVLLDGQRDALVWAGAGLAGLAAIVVAIVVALRLGALRLVEAAMQRAAARWPGVGADWSLTGLQAAFLERQADRGALLRSFLLSAMSWSLGAFEVWVILLVLGDAPGLAACFVIESLAMAARTAGFAIPGALGAQEGGFVLACRLFGIDAETALALSVLKRLRELIIGGAALIAWQTARPR